ncbi:hypothetical protein RHSIM_Rhsim13G0054100 [Rhododendron simsii]|uniref:Pentatricopeptide repeat-containing protein n=1 Tax=Rhododendron simsii TaxID=118357 RepID=A0A834FYJ7_RHOSS|nr:hypothetical protein RHSIM_Rhsim13G0054100 [Rhododendron simsii]
MGIILLTRSICPFSETRVLHGVEGSSKKVLGVSFPNTCRLVLRAQTRGRNNRSKEPKNLRYPRRPKLPRESVTDKFWKDKPSTDQNETRDLVYEDPMVDNFDDTDTEGEGEQEGGDNIVWDSDEIEAISSLFRGRIPQKPGKLLNRERPLPLRLPTKIRPVGFPTPKKHVRMTSSAAVSSRQTFSKRVYKNPSFLVDLAKEIRRLPSDEDVSTVLNKWSAFLRKGSLSLTVRELGHMGLPRRAMETFNWARTQPLLFPDDRILASTVEVLARNRDLKLPSALEEFTTFGSRSVIEAMVRGFIKGGLLIEARKLILSAKAGKRTLDSGIYAKLILELGKNPDKHIQVLPLLEELGERDDLNLNQQGCTAIMKVCIRLGKFDIVESLFNWYKQSGQDPSVVMYTTVIHSRFCQEKYREALPVVWEMEGANCQFDLPAYRVVIKLFVALNDLPRTVRYFSKLKEAGFSPTYDIYRNLFTIYMVSGRVAKCKEVCKEVEMAGFVLDKQIKSRLLQLESLAKSAVPDV